MLVDGVIEEGPAAKAGIKEGDYIVSIDGKDVKNVYDYMGALQNAKAGDVCEVVVRRGEEKIPMKVTLVQR
jgi:S1-C subfamily serine protease